jgi:hypothetical protein
MLLVASRVHLALEVEEPWNCPNSLIENEVLVICSHLHSLFIFNYAFTPNFSHSDILLSLLTHLLV